MIYLMGIVALFWILSGLDLIYGVLFRIPVLSRNSQPPLSHFPKISIIFAARDEGKHIREALQSFLALDYPDFEVIAVNDRSSDQTLSVMQSLKDARLKIIDIKSLPSGWIGKNHALHQGYKVSTGEWIVFTDGDVTFQDPKTLRQVAAFAENGKWDHIALLPHMILKGFLEKIFTTAFGMGFYFHYRPWAASNPRSKSHIGVGAFNFIRRSVYEKLGTHQSFPMNVLDDMELGRRVKLNGFRETAVFGHELISVPWVEGWTGILKSLEKNGYAGVGYNLGVLTFLTGLSFCLNFLPFWLLFAGNGSERIMAAAAVSALFLVYAALQRHHKKTLPVFFFHPLGCALVLFVLWRSALLALRQGGVKWRDTFYSLNQLKKEC